MKTLGEFAASYEPGELLWYLADVREYRARPLQDDIADQWPGVCLAAELAAWADVHGRIETHEEWRLER